MDTVSISIDHLPVKFVKICKKIENQERITDKEALLLIEKASLSFQPLISIL